MIPWLLLEAGYRRLHRVHAQQRLNAARAGMLAQILAQPARDGDDPAARAERILAPVHAEAYPRPGQD